MAPTSTRLNRRGKAAGAIDFRLEWVRPWSELGDRLADWQAAIVAGVRMILEKARARAVEWAKKNRIWTDRSGNARSGLTGRVSVGPLAGQLWLFHTMSYGIYLEIRTRFQRRHYGVLLKAINAVMPMIRSYLKALLSGTPMALA